MTTIQVNERTKTGKELIEAARKMAEKDKGIELIEDNEINDPGFLKKILDAHRSGTVNREKIMETLNRIIEQ